MPGYKKKYSGKKKFKKPSKKAKGAKDKTVTVWSDHSVLEKANRALQIAQNIYRFVNVETKYWDITGLAQNIPDTGAMIALSSITQGTTVNSNTLREGTSVKPLNLVLRFKLNRNTVGGANHQNVRLIVFQAKEENGSTPTVANILENTGTTYSLISPKNYDDRFTTKFLLDKVYPLVYNTNQANKCYSMTFKLSGHINYDASTTTPQTGGYYLLMFGSESSGANYPTIDYYSRLSFTDN